MLLTSAQHWLSIGSMSRVCWDYRYIGFRTVLTSVIELRRYHSVWSYVIPWESRVNSFFLFRILCWFQKNRVSFFIGKEILDFETVHLSFLKNMLGVKQQTTSATIYGDTGRYPLFLKQQILALKYWIRLISLPRSCYLRIVYNSLASLDFIGETNWCSHIRSLFFRTNHRDVWENHRVENANRLIKQVKSCLINTYKVDWSTKARNSIKLQTYIKKIAI